MTAGSEFQLATGGEWAMAMLPWVLIFAFACILIYRQMRHLAVLPPNVDPRRRPPVLDARKLSRVLHLKLLAGGQYDDLDYMVRYWPGDESVSPFLIITLIGRSPCSFYIFDRQAESKVPDKFKLPILQRILNRVAFAPVETGVKTFDAAYRINTSTSSRLVASYLNYPGRQEAVRDLMTAGVHTLLSDAQGIDAHIAPYPHGETFDPKLVQHLLGAMKELVVDTGPQESQVCGELPEVLASAKQRYRLAVMLSLSPLPLFLLPLFVDYGPVGRENNTQLAVTAGICLVPAIVMLVIVYRLFRSARTSPAPEELTPFRSALLDYGRNTVVPIFTCSAALMLTMTGTYALILVLNTHLDRQPATRRVQRVIGVYTERGQPYAEVVPWYESEKAKSLRISQADFDRLRQIGSNDLIDAEAYIEIRTRPGLFGIEWMEPAHLMPTTHPTE